VIGTLAVYHTNEAFYGDDHRRLLDRVCEQASAVIRNAIVFDQTHEASLTESADRLPNTRFMFRHVTRELARTQRLGAEVSLLVLDLNGFKDINDTYGHNAGDLALRRWPTCFAHWSGRTTSARGTAGDEFVIVLAGCSGEEAELKRRELQQGIERIVFQPLPGRPVPLSISVGAAVFPMMATPMSRCWRPRTGGCIRTRARVGAIRSVSSMRPEWCRRPRLRDHGRLTASPSLTRLAPL
jgi:diguanylate cyclase (GGDEF)-like protein